MPDAFSLDDGGNRISVRDIIIRELVANTLVHREYTSPHIARITIDAEGIHTHNASRALYAGPVTPENLDPTPKNPVVANFFTQMGRSEELGSGVRNLYRCSRLYTGRFPRMSDGDSFEAFVPTPLFAADAGSGKAAGTVLVRKRDRTAAEVKKAAATLVAKYGEVSASEIAAGVATVGERTVRRYLAGMVDEGRLSVKKRGRGTVYCKPGNQATEN